MKSNLISFFLITVCFCGVMTLKDYPKVKVCDGSPNTNEGLATDPVTWLRLAYENCTHISYHVIIKRLKEDHNVSFLRSIVDIGGSLIIMNNKISHLALPNLRIIRGKYLFKYTKSREPASLFIGDNEIKKPLKRAPVIDLPSLRSVIRGSIVAEYNTNYCFLNRIDWAAISERDPPKLVIDKNSCDVDKSLTQCNKGCKNKERCWGPELSQCQQLSPTCDHVCSSGGMRSRCFIDRSNIGRCCSDWCAGGCHNRSANACFSCKKVVNGNTCLEFCPQEFLDGLVRRKNPDFKRTLDSFCVKKCPRNYVMNGPSCVKVCPRGTYTDESQKCQACPKDDPTCNGHCHMEDLRQSLPKEQRLTHNRYTSHFLLKKLLNCTTLQTDYIKVNAESVSPRVGKFRVREEDLQNLRNLISVTGCLHLELHGFDKVTNLSFLSKLRSLTCTATDAGLSVTLGANLRYLGLRKLTYLRVAKVTLSKNPKLCYLDRFRDHFDQPFTKTFRNAGTSSQATCVKEGYTCDKQCVPEKGCWGPGNTYCVKCRKLRAGDTCVSQCDEVPGYFFEVVNCSACTKECRLCNGSPESDKCTACTKECRLCNEGPKAGKCTACHKECRLCNGPTARDCSVCVHVKYNGTCMATCPLNTFNDNGVCRLCNSNCSEPVSKTRHLCSGPKALPEKGGCNYCKFIKADKDLKTGECLRTEPPSHYSKRIPKNILRGFTDRNSMLVIPCHPACRSCTASTPESCDKCAKGYLRFKERQCHKKCPSGSFQITPKLCESCHTACKDGCNGTSSSDCFACAKRKYLPVNATRYECVETCPPTHPFSDIDPLSSEILCVKNSPKVAIPPILSIIPIVLLIGGGLCCFYQRRRRLSLMKERELLRAKYIHRVEEEMVPLVSSNVPPNFGQILVIGTKSLQKLGQLGVGAFGTVYRGRWIPEKEKGDEIEVKIDVAIKELHTTTSADSQKFLEEAHVMASVNNPFCVHLLGVCLTSPMQLISELIPLGNLTSYVPRNRQTLSSRILLTWALQIAKGMAYLESRGIVHRDLAARNVLLQRPDLVRITDFGLAKLIDSGDELTTSNASERLPVAWLAFESLIELAFSHKSDVWAYGVTLWEIFTFCVSLPYARMPMPNLVDFLDSGKRLKQPKSCTLDLYMLLLKCWVRDPSARPTFEEIVEKVTDMAKDPERFLCLKIQKSDLKIPPKPPIEQPSLTDGYMPPIKSSKPEEQRAEKSENEEEGIVESYSLPFAAQEATHPQTKDNVYLSVTSSPV